MECALAAGLASDPRAAHARGFILLEADVHALPFADGSFQTVVNTDAFSLHEDPELALRECLRVLSPGGRLSVMEYDDPTDGNPFGTLWALGARYVLRMPRFDSKGLFATAGLPYEDYNVVASVPYICS